MKKKLDEVKHTLKRSKVFKHCRVKFYIEPSISSAVFFITVSKYSHIFKAPFGLLEVMSPEELAYIIIDELLVWRDKYEG